MKAANRAKLSAKQLVAVALAAASIATAAPVSAGESSGTPLAAKPSAPVQWVGVFTGEYVDGAPVYRLPTLSVSVNRKVELAKMAADDKLARAKTARQKASMHLSAPTTDKASAVALNARQ